MSEFTPGPWRIGRFAWTVEAGREDYPALIANVHGQMQGKAGSGDTQLDANARLIAAAPELLEALEAISRESQATTRIRSMAENAIAKARGDA
jgi:hypothetical protein